jgi:hypothetical protein
MVRAWAPAFAIGFSLAVAFAQQNIVPAEALKRQMQQRKLLPSTSPGKVVLPQHRGQSRETTPPLATTCAIPLLSVPLKPTHDRIAREVQRPDIDPKMSVAPRIPACSSK